MKDKLFWGPYARAYDAVMSEYTNHRKLTLLHADKLSGLQRILDSGCGPGHLAKELLSRSHQVEALDLNPESLVLLRKR